VAPPIMIARRGENAAKTSGIRPLNGIHCAPRMARRNESGLPAARGILFSFLSSLFYRRRAVAPQLRE